MTAQIHFRPDEGRWTNTFHDGDGTYISRHGAHPVVLKMQRQRRSRLHLIFREHLEYLRSCPANELYTVKIVRAAMEEILKIECEKLWRSRNDILTICETFDGMMLDNIQSLLGEEEHQGNYEKVVSAMDEIVEAHEKAKGPIYDTDAGWSCRREGNPSFRRSIAAIANWHSERIGAMLSAKAAGGLLPPELCEMIANFYASGKAEKRARELKRKTARMRRWMRYHDLEDQDKESEYETSDSGETEDSDNSD